MIDVISKRIKINKKVSEQMKMELEKESWLYSQKKWKKIAACYLYSLIGHVVVTLPIVMFYRLLFV